MTSTNYIPKRVGCQIPCSGFCILFTNGKNPIHRQKSAMHVLQPSDCHSALKNLEEKNLVKLIPGKTNRKNKEIFLTEEGLLLARKVIVPLMEAETKALDALEEKEMHLFFSLMKKHTDIFKEEINHIIKEEEE